MSARPLAALASAILVLSGCGPAHGAALTTTPSVAAPPEPEPGEFATATGIGATATWTAIRATPGCFFFAGPGELGRDDPYGDGAEIVVREGFLAIGFSEATFFEGPEREGSFLLRRTATYDHGGAWRVKESLEGVIVDGAYAAIYRYEECDLARGDDGEGCPGPCTIEAAVRIVPESR